MLGKPYTERSDDVIEHTCHVRSSTLVLIDTVDETLGALEQRGFCIIGDIMLIGCSLAFKRRQHAYLGQETIMQCVNYFN